MGNLLLDFALNQGVNKKQNNCAYNRGNETCDLPGLVKTKRRT